MYRYLSLNIYTVFVTLLSIVLSIFTVWLYSSTSVHVIWPALLSVGCWPLLKLMLSLHRSSAEKTTALLKLNQLNANEFHLESYEKYMNAPCTRRIVRCSLAELGQLSQYPELKRRYQKHFFIPAPKKTTFKITFYNRPDHSDLTE